MGSEHPKLSSNSAPQNFYFPEYHLFETLFHLFFSEDKIS